MKIFSVGNTIIKNVVNLCKSYVRRLSLHSDLDFLLQGQVESIDPPRRNPPGTHFQPRKMNQAHVRKRPVGHAAINAKNGSAERSRSQTLRKTQSKTLPRRGRAVQALSRDRWAANWSGFVPNNSGRGGALWTNASHRFSALRPPVLRPLPTNSLLCRLPRLTLLALARARN